MIKTLKVIEYFCYAVLIFLALLVTNNNTLLTNLAIYMALLLVSISAYRNSDFQPYLFGLGGKNFVKSITYALGIGLSFFFILKLLPFGSIGLPRLPQTIGENIRYIVILGIAPIVETIFFQSVVYAFLRKTTGSSKIAFFGQAVIFSVAHVSAYISGFYNYPSFTEGLSAIQANIGAFSSAFLFAIVAMYFQIQPKIKNLAFTMVFHGILNGIILTSLSLLFAINGGIF